MSDTLLSQSAGPAPGAPSTPPFIADYQAYDFPPGMIQRIGSIRFTADDLAHALFTTGRAPGNQFSYGKLSVWEFIHRASVIPAYIRRDRNQHLVRSRLARELDRSEKVALSYALGQAITGIFCNVTLSIPFLMHIDRYAERYSLTFSSQKRPDLIGYSSSQGWSVAEAKGRSGAMEFGLRQKLVDQKRSVLSIEGAPPALALGCVASFPPNTAWLRVDTFDPEQHEIEPTAISVNLDRYMLAYYEPFTAAIDAGEAETTDDDAESAPIRAVGFPSLRLRLGLLRSIDQRVRRAIAGELDGLGQSILSDLVTTTRPIMPFPDGTLIETDWEEALTVRDWEY